jgi:uncharacterized membrane protein
VRLSDTVVVSAPIEEVFDAWASLEESPEPEADYC